MRCSELFSMVLAILVATTAAGNARADCARCHASLGEARLRDPALNIRNSAHADAVGCALCHGGDPDDPTVRAHARDTGFVGRPARDQIVLLCGGCHADARFVRRFNAKLPTDQLSLYQMSRHGHLALSGDERAPVCTDCHGSHDVVPVSDRRSPVHPLALPALCERCHGGDERVRGTSDPVAAYRRGMHAAALERGDARAPSCSGCHSGHGELTVGAGSLGGVCSGCHREELRRFRDSPHAKPFKRLGLSTCMPCHDNHDVGPAGPFLLSMGAEGACGRCHAGDDRPAALAAELEGLLAGARDRASRARARLQGAAGLYVDGSEAALAELTTAEHAVGPMVHALDPRALAPALARVAAAAGVLEERIEAAEGHKRLERRGYAVFVGLLALLMLLLMAKALALARRRKVA